MNTIRRPNKLRQIADSRGQSIGAMLAEELALHGTIKDVAEALDVEPMAIYAWTSRNKYRIEHRHALVKDVQR